MQAPHSGHTCGALHRETTSDKSEFEEVRKWVLDRLLLGI